MEAKKYPFRSESGNVKWVAFEQMMEADAMGCLTIGNTEYRRARDLESHSGSIKTSVAERRRTEIVSDAAGFIAEQLPDMEAHRKAHQHHGIEFVPDPTVPGFMRVKASGPRAMSRYIASRGMINKSSKNGSAAMVTAADITNAINLTRRVYC